MKNLDAFKAHGDIIWNIANLLRGPYRPPQYRRVMILLRGLMCPLPTAEEQAEIVSLIDSAIAKIDQMLANTETAITRLADYCSALITAATTGKIDVRQVKIPASP